MNEVFGNMGLLSCVPQVFLELRVDLRCRVMHDFQSQRLMHQTDQQQSACPRGVRLS